MEPIFKVSEKIREYKYMMVNIYADSENALTIIPTGESESHRMTIELDIKFRLTPPYSHEDIENKLHEAIEHCFSYVPKEISYETNQEAAQASRKFNKEVKGKRLVALCWRINEGYIVKPYRKLKPKGFTIIHDKINMLGMELENGSLGQAIVDAILASEPY